MINKKELALESLEGGRAKAIYELLKKAVIEIYDYGNKIVKEMEKDKEDFIENKQFDDKKQRYIILEQYNLPEWNYRFYEDNETWAEFSNMLEDYFSDCDSCERILLIDMKERKCYLLDKEVKTKYITKKIKV